MAKRTAPRLSATRALTRIAWRDPENISERLTLYAAQRMAGSARDWAEGVREARRRYPVGDDRRRGALDVGRRRAGRRSGGGHAVFHRARARVSRLPVAGGAHGACASRRCTGAIPPRCAPPARCWRSGGCTARRRTPSRRSSPCATRRRPRRCRSGGRCACGSARSTGCSSSAASCRRPRTSRPRPARRTSPNGAACAGGSVSPAGRRSG